MRMETIMFENRLLAIEFNYDKDDGYEFYEINDIGAEYFTNEFKSALINKLEKRRL